MKRRWTIFALATAFVVAGNSFGDELFAEGVKLVGGRILPELVKKCDRIDDEFVTATGKEAWDDVMRCLNGKIGPVNHHHASESGTTAKVSTAFGTTWNGPADRGPKVFPPRGKYVTDRPKNFVPGFKKITAAATALQADRAAAEQIGAQLARRSATLQALNAVRNSLVPGMWIQKWEPGRITIRYWKDRVKADGGKTVGERVVEKLKGKTVVVPESVKIADMSAVGKDGPVEQVTIEVKFK